MEGLNVSKTGDYPCVSVVWVRQCNQFFLCLVSDCQKQVVLVASEKKRTDESIYLLSK